MGSIVVAEGVRGRPKEVTIYTDGACLGNPGPGGYGIVLLYGTHRKELFGGYRMTTNNRMELLAAIIALEALKERCSVTLYSDSEYLVKAIEQGWARKWKSNDWRRSRKGKAVNPDLWGRLLSVCDRQDVRFSWVKGHAGNPENERCDRLANEAAEKVPTAIDEEYERLCAR